MVKVGAARLAATLSRSAAALALPAASAAAPAATSTVTVPFDAGVTLAV